MQNDFTGVLPFLFSDANCQLVSFAAAFQIRDNRYAIGDGVRVVYPFLPEIKNHYSARRPVSRSCMRNANFRIVRRSRRGSQMREFPRSANALATASLYQWPRASAYEDIST
jgi:hypothetical protein